VVRDRLDGIYQRRYFFDGNPPQPQASRVTRVGARDGRTGLWEVIHPDGSITLNGIANFSRGIAPGTVVSGIPTGDGFIVLNAENLLPTVEEIVAAAGLQQVLFFGVAEGQYINPPVLSPSPADPIISSISVYVKVGLAQPVLLLTLDVPKMQTLFGAFLPNSKLIDAATGNELETVPTLSGPSLQICTALSPSLFLVNILGNRTNATETQFGLFCYTAICSFTGVLGEHLSPAGSSAIAGDPVGNVPWGSALAPYADWLPTRPSDRVSSSQMRSALYEEAEPIFSRWFRTNIDGDRQVTKADPEDTVIDWTSIDSASSFLPIGTFIKGERLPITANDENVGALQLSLPFGTWINIGVGNQQVWGLTQIPGGPGIVTVSNPLTEIYSTPEQFEIFRLGPFEFDESVGFSSRSLLISPAPFSGSPDYDEWTLQPYQLVSMPALKVLSGQ
jgi:hypothetical protein